MLNLFMHYLFGNTFAKILGLISLPIYTYFISPQEYGLFSIIMSYIAVSTFLFTMNVHTSVSRFLYEENVNVNSFISATIILTCISFIMVFSALSLIDDSWLNSFLGFNFSLYETYFYLLIFFSAFSLIYMQILVPSSKGKEHSALSVLQAYMRFGIIMIFFYFIESTALRMLQGIVIADAIISIYIFWKLKNYFTFIFNMSNVKYILNYSVLLIPYTISGVVLAQIDRVMIGSILGETEAGIYSVAYIIGSVPLMIYASLSNAWMPKYFTCMNEKKFDLLDRDTVSIVFIFSGVVIIFSTFMGYIFTLVLANNYHNALQYIPLITISMFFAIMWNIWGRGIGYAKKTLWSSVVGTISAVANIYLNSIFIPSYGIDGAVYATYLSYMLMAYLGYLLAKYLLNIHTTSMRKIKIPWIFIFIYTVGYLVFKNNFILLMSLLLPFGVLALYYINMKEVHQFFNKSR